MYKSVLFKSFLSQEQLDILVIKQQQLTLLKKVGNNFCKKYVLTDLRTMKIMREAPSKIKDVTNYSEAFFEKVSLVIQILSFSHLIQMKYIFKVF